MQIEETKILLGTGALREEPDYRDYLLQELYNTEALGNSFTWREKPQSEWKKFPIRSQGSSSSCVAHTVAKLLGTENHKEENLFPILSALDIYDRRSNKPDLGMYIREGMLIGKTHGATLEEFFPSQNMTEGEMNKPVIRTNFTKKIGEIIKGGAVISVPDSIDLVASILNKGKCVAMGINFGDNYNQPVPELPKNNKFPSYHAIVGVDFTLWQGKKAIIIEDSWGTAYGFQGQRVITEDWFKAGRIDPIYYYEDLSNNWMDNSTTSPAPTPNAIKPTYNFQNDLGLEQEGKEVKILQECLKYLKFFPDIQECTGYFGGITFKSVVLFQEAYRKEVLEPLSLKYGTGYVGEATRKKLNELFS